MGLWFLTIAIVCISIKKFSPWWKTKTQNDITKLQKKAVISVAIFAIICATIPWTTGNYEYLGGWCWINDDDVGHALRYVCYYGWLIIALFITIIIYFELFRIIRKENKFLDEDEYDDDETTQQSATSTQSGSSPRIIRAPTTLDTKKRQKKMFDQMKLYPWALIIGQGPGAIRRLIQLFDRGFDAYWLAVIHAICSGLFGFITAVIYGTKTWQIYAYKMKSCCNIQDNDDDDDGNDVEVATPKSNVDDQ